MYPLNDIHGSNEGHGAVSASLCDAPMPVYFSLQLDVMNALQYRGDTGERGISLEAVLTSTMKNILRRWINVAQRSKELRQLHLHIDDLSYVIAHKTAKQKRRDSQRLNCSKQTHADDGMDGVRRNPVGFKDELVVQWSTLLQD